MCLYVNLIIKNSVEEDCEIGIWEEIFPLKIIFNYKYKKKDKNENILYLLYS